MEIKSAIIFFFFMIRGPPRSTRVRSSAASDVYKRQEVCDQGWGQPRVGGLPAASHLPRRGERQARDAGEPVSLAAGNTRSGAGLVDRSDAGGSRPGPVSY